MAITAGRFVTVKPFCGNGLAERNGRNRKDWIKVRAAAVSSVRSSAPLKEEYEILKVNQSASEKDIKRAFRRLALQYHPDVCKGENCGVSFNRINQAYETLLASFKQQQHQSYPDYYVEDLMGVNMDCWDEWEEWMGWEGAGTLDYSNHINSFA